MANWRVHILFGFCFCLVTYFIIVGDENLWKLTTNFIIYIPFVFLVSQLPDIDSKTSIIHKFVITFGICFALGLFIIAYISKIHLYTFFGFSIIIVLVLIKSFKHRGSMHTIAAAIIVPIPILIFSWKIYIICVAAYFSHLLLDGEFSFF